jgi:hypothetical protein
MHHGVGNTAAQSNRGNNQSFNVVGSYNTYTATDPLAVEREEILKWLSPLEPRKRHQDVRASRLEDTGNWLLEMAQFETWRDGDSQSVNPLCCYGAPGAGKTVIWYIILQSRHTSQLV